MPTLKLQGWLGNQMFQYALAYSLSRENNEEIIFDGDFLENRFFAANWTFRHYELDVFGIEKKYTIPNLFSRKFLHPIAFEFLKKIQYGKRYMKEKSGQFIKSFPKNSYLDGWFQSYKYFEKYSSDITKIFTVKTPISEQNQEMLDSIASAWDNAVSLHVRRGDYVSLISANKWHGVCSLGYYETAINSMKEKLANPVFFVFSDDIAWCRENIHFPEWMVAYYVDHNGSAGHEDLRLMYSCSHHITANSSFSWWWAYLGRNPGKTIIAPKKWFQADTFLIQYLIPHLWILL